MSLIACPECQQPVSNQAVACPKCGFPVIDATILDCPECGRTISAWDEVCPGCGFPLQPTDPEPQDGTGDEDERAVATPSSPPADVTVSAPTEATAETPPRSILCPGCGTANPQHARFCRSCGQSLPLPRSAAG